MFRAKKLVAAVVMGLALVGGTVCGARAAEEKVVVTEENLPQLLEKLFRERPELVMDVLRSQSESVLEIAQQGSNLRRKHSLEAQWAVDLKIPKTVKTAGRPIMGSPKAKVRIVEFSDFTCHFCQQASKTVDAILQEYGKDVCLVFKSMLPGRLVGWSGRKNSIRVLFRVFTSVACAHAVCIGSSLGGAVVAIPVNAIGDIPASCASSGAGLLLRGNNFHIGDLVILSFAGRSF